MRSRILSVLGIALVSSAHVGSPDAWYSGNAGPYPITVHIESPVVVPGIATVNVRADADGIERVTAFVNTFDADGGTPPPDDLIAAADRPGWRRARLWVMNAGSNRVTVAVHGTRGTGSVVVPLAAVAQRRLAVSPAFVAAMVVVIAFLGAGMLTLVGAAVREGALAPGAEPDAERRGRARLAMWRAAGVIALVLAGTGAWWRAEDRAFRSRMFRPLSVNARLEADSMSSRFVLTIDDPAWLRRDDVALVRARGDVLVDGLVDDHGKLMHLFLVTRDGSSAMAHLHPVTTDTITFSALLPPLPPGDYRIFADIVHANGFAQTLTSTLEIPARVPSSHTLSDADDSWAVAGKRGGPRLELEDGSVLTWLRPDGVTLRAGEEAGLRFRVEPPPGDSALLDDYLGMRGHAAVVRSDGQVFIHLHPMGTVSPAAQARLSPVTAHRMDHAGPPTGATEVVQFPYAFPDSGAYTVWVQLKRRDRVLTGAFTATVGARSR